MRVDKNKVLLLMAKQGLLQQDVASKATMSKGNFSTIMNGKNCQPRTVLKIATALSVDVTEIIEDQEGISQ